MKTFMYYRVMKMIEARTDGVMRAVSELCASMCYFHSHFLIFLLHDNQTVVFYANPKNLAVVYYIPTLAIM